LEDTIIWKYLRIKDWKVYRRGYPSVRIIEYVMFTWARFTGMGDIGDTLGRDGILGEQGMHGRTLEHSRALAGDIGCLERESSWLTQAVEPHALSLCFGVDQLIVKRIATETHSMMPLPWSRLAHSIRNLDAARLACQRWDGIARTNKLRHAPRLSLDFGFACMRNAG